MPDGNELADEGEEIRAMDLAAVPLRRGSDSQQLVAVGYSDGIVRVGPFLFNRCPGDARS